MGRQKALGWRVYSKRMGWQNRDFWETFEEERKLREHPKLSAAQQNLLLRDAALIKGEPQKFLGPAPGPS